MSEPSEILRRERERLVKAREAGAALIVVCPLVFLAELAYFVAIGAPHSLLWLNLLIFGPFIAFAIGMGLWWGGKLGLRILDVFDSITPSRR